jgi:hypothetical protein
MRVFHEVESVPGYENPFEKFVKRVLTHAQIGFIFMRKVKEDYEIIIDPIILKVDEERRT